MTNAVDYCDKVHGHAWLAEMRSTVKQVCTAGVGRLFSYRSPVMDTSPFVVLDYHNVLVDYTRIRPPRPETGAEEDEYFGLSSGAFRLACNTDTADADLSNSLLGQWVLRERDWFRATADVVANTELAPFLFTDTFPYADCDTVVEEPTILVKRFEYANIYHQFTDYVNVEIAHQLLGLGGNVSVTVELFDGHRHSDIDEVWERVFNSHSDNVQPSSTPHPFLSGLNSRLRRKVVQKVCYKRLIIASPGYGSRTFAMHERPDPCNLPSPFYAAVRERFLRAFHIEPETATADPENCIVIARRNYQAHPRNPEGRISRKFADELAVLRAAATAGVQCSIFDLARVPFEEQVQRIAHASILMGLHGAGLSFVFLLPPTSVLIEARIEIFEHFNNMAAYSGRHYVGMPSYGWHAQEFVTLDESKLTSAFATAVKLRQNQTGLMVPEFLVN